MEQRSKLEGKQLLLGVCGSIAAYKAVDILRRLQERGASVRVVMTRNAERFVSRLTFETLSGNPVPGTEFQDWEQQGIGHIELTDGLDAALVAPATANVIGKAAAGIADDTLTTALTAVQCPVIMAPAMNDRMYRNPIVQGNIEFLRQQGVRFVEPGTGQLACGVVGQGRLADADAILQAVSDSFKPGDLSGLTVLITAGPTREQIDAVRFISNPSTGKMGFAVAAEASARGARVILVSGPTDIAPPRGPQVVRVSSAADMQRAVMEHLGQADIVVMTAAVTDFRPRSVSDRKIKKQDAPSRLDLELTDDILKTVGSVQGRRFVVGFAAETDDLIRNAEKKLREKNLDMIVANDLLRDGAGFGSETNSVVIIDRSGAKSELPVMSKKEIAARILDAVMKLKEK